MADVAPPVGFSLSAPVAILHRVDGLSLRGREGELHVVAVDVIAAPAGWVDAAASGVTVIGPVAATDAAPAHWRVAAGGSVWSVPLSRLQWHRPLPGLLEPLGLPFRAGRVQRVLGRLLVRLLGVPGVVPLLVGWHRRRTRKAA